MYRVYRSRVNGGHPYMMAGQRETKEEACAWARELSKEHQSAYAIEARKGGGSALPTYFYGGLDERQQDELREQLAAFKAHEQAKAARCVLAMHDILTEASPTRGITSNELWLRLGRIRELATTAIGDEYVAPPKEST